MIDVPNTLEVMEGDVVSVTCSSSVPELNQQLAWRKITDGTASSEIVSQNVRRLKLSSCNAMHVLSDVTT